MMLRNSLLVVTLCAVACGPGAGTSTIPELPGDGDEHTAKPRAPKEPGDGPSDPWAGRANLVEPPGPMQPEPIELPAVKRFTLSNGLQVLAIERRDVPVISAQLALKVGRADASRDKMGIEQVVARVLAAGTKKRDAAALQAMLERADARLSAQASYENTLVSCAVRSESARTCLDAMVELVSAPAFPAAAVEAAQLELDRAALARQEDPAQLAAAHFQNQLWGKDHVRGWPMSRATAAAITRADVVAWHKRYFTPRNAVLAIAGDFDTAKMKPQLENAFRSWRATSKVPPRVAKPAPERERIAARLVDFPGEERAHIRIGQVGIRHDDPDFNAVSVLAELLGGSGASRLTRSAREAGGATAGASAGFDRNADAGIFVISAVAPAKDAVAVIRGALQEIEQVRKKAPPEPEMRAVVTQMSGRYGIGFETVAQIANVLLAAELHGHDLQKVANYPVALGRVTPEQVRAAAEKLLDAETPAIVIVGDAKIIGPQLQAVGVVFETVGRQQPVGSWEREATAPVTPQAEAQAKKILAAALKAKGGKAKLEGIKSLVLEGNARGVIQDPRSGKQTFEAQVKRSYVAPDKMRRDLTRKVDGQEALSGIVLSGNEAWAFERVGAQQGAGELPPELVAALETQMWRDQDLILLRYLDPGVTAALMADKDIDGAPQHVVRLTRKDGVSSVLYIDKKTNLLTRQSYSAEGSSASETYTDYKNVGGIQVPHRRLTAEGSTRFDMTVTKIQFNVTIPAEAFAKPKQ
ncbi:MAG TPA: insulinase family protein [Kofleriaceae bacterium]|nr:insulinase family protein [Kofleriaceae bacterium]